jgi:hypothetical protein
MAIAATSGGAGDILYSIQVMRRLNVEKVYVKRSFYDEGEGNLYENICPLLEYNGFEVFPTSGSFPVGSFAPGLKYDYNLDNFRNRSDRGRIHIIANQHRAFGVRLATDWNKPWLRVDDQPSGLPADTTVFNVTQRWRGSSRLNWREVMALVPGRKVFVGLRIDHQLFEQEAGEIDHFRTKDFMEMARVIRDSKAFYCNQSVGLVIAQGLGKEYWCQFKPGKTNCIMYTKNEHVLTA